jgi:chorismate synthase
VAGNSFGTLFRVTTFGESHGEGIGVVIDGCPSGLKLDFELIQRDLDRRKPGQSKITTQRKESDQAQFLSGLFEGKTTGAPIAAFIKNEDQRAKDYDHLRDRFRPSHADYTYQTKYGLRDHRGGGRSSARETASRVVAGSIAKQILKDEGIEVSAYVSQVGAIELKSGYQELDLSKTDDSIVRCPHKPTAEKMIALIEKVRKEGDTVGGVVSGVVTGTPVGLGEPAFDKLHADLAKAMMSINATKGFEYGSGFSGVSMKGSEHNDLFISKKGKVSTKTNHSGGIQGGISNGMDIYFRVAFKPVATILKKQKSIDVSGHDVELEGRGRHDPCVVPRAVAIVEAMAALVLVDHLLRFRALGPARPNGRRL